MVRKSSQQLRLSLVMCLWHHLQAHKVHKGSKVVMDVTARQAPQEAVDVLALTEGTADQGGLEPQASSLPSLCVGIAGIVATRDLQQSGYYVTNL